jgi:hypothetical protein
MPVRILSVSLTHEQKLELTIRTETSQELRIQGKLLETSPHENHTEFTLDIGNPEQVNFILPVGNGLVEY